MCRGIESNPGPKTKTKKPTFFSFCHWNITSLLSNSKLLPVYYPMLEAYNIAQINVVICISDSYLDSTVSLDDNTFSLNGNNFTREDHPDDVVKRAGVCCTTNKTYL